MNSLFKVKGISEDAVHHLQATCGVRSTYTFLAYAATPYGRRALAARTGFSETSILRWAHQADLLRVRGVGEEYADLLEAAGVSTVSVLAQHNAAQLHETLLHLNQRQARVNRVPARVQIERWIRQAKNLPPSVVEEA